MMFPEVRKHEPGNRNNKKGCFPMISWKNLDELKSYQALCAKPGKVNLREAMQGENGAERVSRYAVPMAEGLSYHYAAKAVDDSVLASLKALAQEAQLSEKYQALFQRRKDNRRVFAYDPNRACVHFRRRKRKKYQNDSV